MKNSTERFEAEIAKAVSLILAASQAVATEALNEAFSRAGQPGAAAAVPAPRATVAAGPASSSRRSTAEIAALQERIFDAIMASPGEPMSVLAPRVNSTPTALQVPVMRLKAAGRIKTVGTRQFTRYFPIACSETVDRNLAA